MSPGGQFLVSLDSEKGKRILEPNIPERAGTRYGVQYGGNEEDCGGQAEPKKETRGAKPERSKRISEGIPRERATSKELLKSGKKRCW